MCFSRKGMKTVMKWLRILLVIAVVMIAVFGCRMAKYSMSIKPQTLEEAEKWQQEHGDISWWYDADKTDYTVKGYQDYVLHVELIRNDTPTDKYVIISHGYTDNHIGSLKYAGFYLKLGFNVIVYDLRGHGSNEKDFCSYSVREAKDLIALIEDSQQRYPDARVWGLHGESLGAATSVMCLKYKPKVDFVVADCPFSDISDVLKVGLRGMHLPESTVYVASLYAKIIYGISYGEMRPIDSLKDNEIPILFIHGAEDKFIKPYHSERMREATKGYSEVFLMPKADHAVSVFADPGKYGEVLAEFLNNISIE